MRGHLLHLSTNDLNVFGIFFWHLFYFPAQPACLCSLTVSFGLDYKTIPASAPQVVRPRQRACFWSAFSLFSSTSVKFSVRRRFRQTLVKGLGLRCIAFFCLLQRIQDSHCRQCFRRMSADSSSRVFNDGILSDLGMIKSSSRLPFGNVVGVL